jgi:hypothetical protein
VRELAAQADIVLENYKVGQLAKYGLDYASLSALNPRLVYCSVTGFGQTGPYAQAGAGYDFAIQATGGLMSVTGEKDGTMAANRRRWAWPWPTCSPGCTPPPPSWPRCARREPHRPRLPHRRRAAGRAGGDAGQMDMKTSPLSTTLNDPSLLKTDALIGGEWVAGDARFDVTDPATGLKLADVANLGPADVPRPPSPPPTRPGRPGAPRPPRSARRS